MILREEVSGVYAFPLKSLPAKEGKGERRRDDRKGKSYKPEYTVAYCWMTGSCANDSPCRKLGKIGLLDWALMCQFLKHIHRSLF